MKISDERPERTVGCTDARRFDAAPEGTGKVFVVESTAVVDFRRDEDADAVVDVEELMKEGFDGTTGTASPGVSFDEGANTGVGSSKILPENDRAGEGCPV